MYTPDSDFCLLDQTLIGLFRAVEEMRKISFMLIVLFSADDDERLVVKTHIPMFRPDDQELLLKKLGKALQFVCRGEPGTTLVDLWVYDQNRQRTEQIEAHLKEKFQGKITEDILALC